MARSKKRSASSATTPSHEEIRLAAYLHWLATGADHLTSWYAAEQRLSMATAGKKAAATRRAKATRRSAAAHKAQETRRRKATKR